MSTSMSTDTDITADIEALGTMTTRELRDRYHEVFDDPSRSNNRRWLIRRIAWRLQAREQGGLSERALARAHMLARDEDLRVRPPRDRGPQLGSHLRTVSGTLVRRIDERVPIPGTVLRRIYRGAEHRVTVLPNGFEHEGTVYRSLSAVAQAITGSHWNGFGFFGLTKGSAR